MFALVVSVAVVALLCGALAANLAEVKGGTAWVGFVIGFVAGPLGLLWAVGLPDVYARHDD